MNRPEQLSISYNGGKDCVVLLVLILACLPLWAFSSDPNPAPSSDSPSYTNKTNKGESQPPIPKPLSRPLQAVYIISKQPFPEVETFVEASATEYHLDLARYALPMRPGLEAYLSEKPDVKAIFVGTRRTDPHGEFLTHFDPTDKDWPQFMRIHPVINWHYVEIWAVSHLHSINYRLSTTRHSWEEEKEEDHRCYNEKLANIVSVHPPLKYPVL